MKIIDEKGKLFGKLNIIDLLAILILVAALVFVAAHFLGPDDSGSTGSTKLTYTAVVNGMDRSIYNEVLRQMDAAGGRDQLMANGELLDAYVTKVEAVPHVSYAADANGQMVRSVEEQEGSRLDVTFTVEAQVADPVTNKVGTQEVRVGKGHILKTTHFEFTYSSIVTCEWE